MNSSILAHNGISRCRMLIGVAAIAAAASLPAATLAAALALTQERPASTASKENRHISTDDPHKLVFFEVFSSAAAHELHLEQDYTKRLMASLEGKLSGVPTLTKLSAL